MLKIFSLLKGHPVTVQSSVFQIKALAFTILFMYVFKSSKNRNSNKFVIKLKKN